MLRQRKSFRMRQDLSGHSCSCSVRSRRRTNDALLFFLVALIGIYSSHAQEQSLYRDASASIEDRVSDILSQMTLREKVGQMIMDIENTDEVAPDIGAYFVGANGFPSTHQWIERLNELQENSANTRLGIPVLVGADAVHGHNLAPNSTIFPHNIGLGCMRNTSLARQIAQATAAEMMATGLHWTFAPNLAVARDITWGRTYESYSEDTDLVTSYAAPFVEGLQQQKSNNDYYSGVIATAKHWIGDGQEDPDDLLDIDEVMAIHGAPFDQAIAANVAVVMLSSSSAYEGIPLHQHHGLITSILKDIMFFDGFVLSDWMGWLTNLSDDYKTQVQLSVNAGVDMFMAPNQAYGVINSITESVESGDISHDRIDDAVRRILRVKFRAGLLDKFVNASPPYLELQQSDAPEQVLGSLDHRAVARQAVRESLVLLKNQNYILPLSIANDHVLVAGKNAHNLRNQCGGWTLSWQGDAVTQIQGTTILQGLERLSQGNVTYSLDGSLLDPSVHSAVVAVVGETPYADESGDSNDLSLDSEDQQLIADIKKHNVPIVLVLVSGRPMIVDLDGIEAFVAAWLPGTEGDGVAEVLYGHYGFTGKLSFSWPANMEQLQSGGFLGSQDNLLYPFGHGMRYMANPLLSAAPVNSPTTSPVDEGKDDDGGSLSPVGGDTTKSPTTTGTPVPALDTLFPTMPPTSRNGDDKGTPTRSPTTTPHFSLTGSSPTIRPTDQSTITDDKTALPNGNADDDAFFVGDDIAEIDQGETNEDKNSSAITDDATKVDDSDPPSRPGTPKLEASTPTSISFSWMLAVDNVDVKHYIIYDKSRQVSTSTDTNFTATGLEPGSLHSYTVAAVDAAGNVSPSSDTLVASTTISVDAFGDGDYIAEDGWGAWGSDQQGDSGDGFTRLVVDGGEAELTYMVDSGDWGYCNLYLAFDEGSPVDLTDSYITGIKFAMRGTEGGLFRVRVGFPLSESSRQYYHHEFELSETWTRVTLSFDTDFVADPQVSYSIREALQSATSIVWETAVVGSQGWISIDDVEFLTPSSTVSIRQVGTSSASQAADLTRRRGLNSVAASIILALALSFWSG